MLVDARATDAAAAIRDATGGGAHVALDALGSARTCAASVESLRKRGRHVQVGLMLAGDRVAPVPMARVIANELSRGRPRHGRAPLPGAAGGGRRRPARPARLVGATVALADAGAELAALGGFARHGTTVIDSFA